MYRYLTKIVSRCQNSVPRSALYMVIVRFCRLAALQPASYSATSRSLHSPYAPMIIFFLPEIHRPTTPCVFFQAPVNLWYTRSLAKMAMLPISFAATHQSNLSPYAPGSTKVATPQQLSTHPRPRQFNYLERTSSNSRDPKFYGTTSHIKRPSNMITDSSVRCSSCAKAYSTGKKLRRHFKSRKYR